MPSASLLNWRNERMNRLAGIDAQCAASLSLVPPNLGLLDENLRGYAMLLSAHFQGYCRDLYTECSQIVVSKVRTSLKVLIQDQFTAGRKLDHGNPTLDSIREDFRRFGFRLDFVAADPANAGHISNLARMNKWRNVAAHHGKIPLGVPLDLHSLQSWRNSCDQLATSLDDIIYNRLRRILRHAPWIP
jgi:hypothetical protein